VGESAISHPSPFFDWHGIKCLAGSLASADEPQAKFVPGSVQIAHQKIVVIAVEREDV